MKWDITVYPDYIKSAISNYYKQHCTHKFGNLGEIG